MATQNKQNALPAIIQESQIKLGLTAVATLYVFAQNHQTPEITRLSEDDLKIVPVDNTPISKESDRILINCQL